ncbi:DNA-binding LacI/PurR family transcriptional regulator [Kineococcus xinjiangensis]|uniref:DNA-binding LacI/PurR family transcriptional regulator n=1 Tax=Kineococcus xinjiangensis TaxID=512762 RepID=A0A2S6IWE9_9ACTN|nr:LacI family DNA-binding transcriptional regulator [Kineococcus xinjiangensis]PPK98689.1 DNA-binding LacI/PurR family transcriptional regulator [Kineococcus xinjiangensis]
MPETRTPARTPRRSGRVSIVDVAAAAGVSRQTVSNVLNGRKEYYSEDTHSRVIAAMDSLGYQPNRAAQSLRSQRSMQIGWHIFGEQLQAMRGFTLQFLQALVKATSDVDHHLVVFTHHDDDALQVFKDLVARRTVDAVILSESGVDDERARFLAEHGLPFASFGRLAPDLPQHWVDIDNAAGMHPLVDHLVSAGHRQFAYIGAEGGEFWKAERLEGFRTALAEHGLRVPANAVLHGDDAAVRAHTRRLLARRNRPTAIVAGNDAIAAVVVNVVHSVGLRAGRDVAVTGFDGGAIGLFTEPTLTSVRIPVERIARELVDRCLRQVRDGAVDGPGLLVPTEIVRGGSA